MYRSARLYGEAELLRTDNVQSDQKQKNDGETCRRTPSRDDDESLVLILVNAPEEGVKHAATSRG